MDTEFWIHCIIFIVVFVVTAVVLSRRMKKKENKTYEGEYQEIQAEIFDTEKLQHQAKLEKEEARKERQMAEELMRMSIEERDQTRDIKYLSDNEMRDPYAILGVHKNDSLDTIKEVYQQLIDIYNPDKHQAADNLSIDQKKEMIARIEVAYEWLLKYH